MYCIFELNSLSSGSLGWMKIKPPIPIRTGRSERASCSCVPTPALPQVEVGCNEWNTAEIPAVMLWQIKRWEKCFLPVSQTSSWGNNNVHIEQNKKRKWLRLDSKTRRAQQRTLMKPKQGLRRGWDAAHWKYRLMVHAGGTASPWSHLTSVENVSHRVNSSHYYSTIRCSANRVISIHPSENSMSPPPRPHVQVPTCFSSEIIVDIYKSGAG